MMKGRCDIPKHEVRTGVERQGEKQTKMEKRRRGSGEEIQSSLELEIHPRFVLLSLPELRKRETRGAKEKARHE